MIKTSTEVVINKCYGGFSISPEAILWLYENRPLDNFFDWSDFDGMHDGHGPNAFADKANEILAEWVKAKGQMAIKNKYGVWLEVNSFGSHVESDVAYGILLDVKELEKT